MSPYSGALDVAAYWAAARRARERDMHIDNSWLMPYKLLGPLPERGNPDVDAVLSAAEERDLCAHLEPGLVIRIIHSTQNWYVGFRESLEVQPLPGLRRGACTRKVQRFYEANSEAMIWQAGDLEDFVLHLKGMRLPARVPTPFYGARG